MLRGGQERRYVYQQLQRRRPSHIRSPDSLQARFASAGRRMPCWSPLRLMWRLYSFCRLGLISDLSSWKDILCTYTVAGVNVVVAVLVPGILRKELQNVVPGGPTFLRTLRAPVTFEQSIARLSRCAAGVGSGQAVTNPLTVAARRSLNATMASVHSVL